MNRKIDGQITSKTGLSKQSTYKSSTDEIIKVVGALPQII